MRDTAACRLGVLFTFLRPEVSTRNFNRSKIPLLQPNSRSFLFCPFRKRTCRVFDPEPPPSPPLCLSRTLKGQNQYQWWSVWLVEEMSSFVCFPGLSFIDKCGDFSGNTRFSVCTKHIFKKCLFSPELKYYLFFIPRSLRMVDGQTTWPWGTVSQ